MSAGKAPKAKDYSSQVAAATTPKDYYTPFGNQVQGHYTPLEGQATVDARNQGQTDLASVLHNMPTSYSAQDAFNNPFYQTTSDLYRQPIQQHQQADQQALDNKLAAQNQLGSSYDAYSHHLMNQDYGNQYLQADNLARLAAAGQYNTGIQQGLQAIPALQGQYNSSLQAALMPAQIAQGYQNSVSPLQQSQAQYYTTMGNTSLQGQNQAYIANLQGLYGLGSSAIGALGTAAGGALTPAGGGKIVGF